MEKFITNKKSIIFRLISVVLLLVLMLSLISCGNTSNPAEDENTADDNIVKIDTGETETDIVMQEEDNNGENIAEIDNSETEIGVMTQDYIDDNIAEILMIKYDGQQKVFEEYNWRNPEIQMLNNSIKFGIQQIYLNFMENKSENEWIEIKSYPFTSDEYLQIVTTHVIYPTYGTDGNITSYNFDKKTNTFMTVYDEMAKLGLTVEIIKQNIEQLYVPEMPSMSIGQVTPTGFLIREGATGLYTMFLLEVIIENPEAEPWQAFFAYSPQLSEFYRLNNYCLFDPYEMDVMDPPLSYAPPEE